MDFRLDALVVSLTLVATVAAAQDEATPTEAGSEPQRFGEEIVVTGSRVPRKDLTSPGPVVVYGRQEIAESGVVSVGEFLRLTPWQGGGLNSNDDGASDGSTQVSLRNLGPRRTLVLVDGQRWVNGGVGAGSGFIPGVDLNTIPAAAVERIEVLKDGASAVYGSDAVAGVVNIITRRRMSGAEVEAYSGISSQGDALQAQVNGTTGLSGDRGGFLVSLGYLHQSPVLTSDRPWADRLISYDFRARRVNPSGSSAIPAGAALVDPAKCPTQLCQLLNAAYPGAGPTSWIANGNPGMGVPVVTDPLTGQQWRKFIGSGPVNDLDNSNSAQAMTYHMSQSNRLSLFTNGDYRLTDFARARLQVSFVRNETRSQLASEPLFTSFVGSTIDPTNPYNPFGVPVTQAFRRLVELGPRAAEPDEKTVRVATGLDGTVERARWAASFVYGRTSTSTLESGPVDKSRVASALGPAFQDQNGVRHCGTPAAPIAGCTPVNLFGAGSITPSMAQALGPYSAGAYGWSQLALVDAQVGRDLFMLAADRPAGIAAGYQFRREAGGFRPNAIAAAGHSFDFAAPGLSGGFDVQEAYVELVLPIVSQIPLVDDFEVQAVGRTSHYSSYGTNLTYMLGGRWRPLGGFTLRGTWSTAFRAPPIDDLYSGQVNTFERATDPCGSIPASNAALRAQCAAGPGGASAVNNGDTGNAIPSTTGGNPGLQPETATTATIGAVIEPAQVKGLSLSADYYHVRLDDAITTNLGTVLILGGCYPALNSSSAAPDGRDCSLIRRDPTTGRIQGVSDVEQNAGSLITDGVDVVLRYALPSAAGRFRFSVDGNYLIKQDVVLPSGKVLRSAGNYDLAVFSSSLGVTPRLRFGSGVDYDRGQFAAGIRARYVGGFDECASAAGTTSAGRGLCSDHNVDPTIGLPFPVHRVASNTAFDVYTSYALRSTGGTTSISLGVRNAFDARPPVVYSSFLTYADPSYDFVGRFVYARIAHKF
jgi:iron complex outermembrane receptor protein